MALNYNECQAIYKYDMTAIYEPERNQNQVDSGLH